MGQVLRRLFREEMQHRAHERDDYRADPNEPFCYRLTDQSAYDSAMEEAERTPAIVAEWLDRVCNLSRDELDTYRLSRDAAHPLDAQLSTHSPRPLSAPEALAVLMHCDERHAMLALRQLRTHFRRDPEIAAWVKSRASWLLAEQECRDQAQKEAYLDDQYDARITDLTPAGVRGWRQA